MTVLESVRLATLIANPFWHPP